jgi:ankyrin repeat protein
MVIFIRHAAVSYSQLELIKFLLSVGANIHIKDNEGDTPILFCEDAETFEYLVSCGANTSDINESGESIFEKVVEDENLAMIQYLIEKGYVNEEKVASFASRISGIDCINEEGNYEEESEDDNNVQEDVAMNTNNQTD